MYEQEEIFAGVWKQIGVRQRKRIHQNVCEWNGLTEKTQAKDRQKKCTKWCGVTVEMTNIEN